jgi:hypothetical protein
MGSSIMRFGLDATAAATLIARGRHDPDEARHRAVSPR